MQHAPTYLLQKVQQSMDPYAPVRQPNDWMYRSSRWIRDFPLEHPVLSIMGAATPLGAIFGPAASLGWAGAAAYSTGRELAAAIPSFARGLARIGGGRHEFFAPMLDTNAARSMRQASLRAIHDSGYMLRAVIGQEARILHK